MNATKRERRQGFTLLEVMISIAILSLGLATVFGSAVMGARGSAHARNVTDAAMMARCRMTEVEAYLGKNGFQETEQTLEDPPDMTAEKCCEGAFRCTARIEKIELPQPADVSTAAGSGMLSAAAGAAQGSSFSGDGGMGAMGQLATAMGALGASGGSGDGLSAMLGGVGGSGLAGSGAPNLQAMAGQLMSGIYPTIKPLLEGAIRKVTVRVAWNEGSREWGFDVVQYYTNPGQTFQSGEILDRMQNGLLNNGANGNGGNPPPGGPPPPPPLPH